MGNKKDEQGKKIAKDKKTSSSRNTKQASAEGWAGRNLEALHERCDGAALFEALGNAVSVGLGMATKGEDGLGAGAHHRSQGRPLGLKEGESQQDAGDKASPSQA